MGTIINIKKRREDKFCLTMEDIIFLENFLSKVFAEENNSVVTEGYNVHSLYFDTQDKMTLRQKIEGDQVRQKFRIRCYNQDKSEVYLEVKSKDNNLSTKSRLKIEISILEVFKHLKKGKDLGSLFLNEDIKNSEFFYYYYKYQIVPISLISFKRRAYEDTLAEGLRITIDTKLRGRWYDKLSSFESQPSTDFNIKQNTGLLEIKYTGYVPRILEIMLKDFKDKKCSFSKYAEVCLNLLNRNNVWKQANHISEVR